MWADTTATTSIAINIRVLKRAEVPARERTHPQRYLRSDMQAEDGGQGRFRAVADALFRRD